MASKCIKLDGMCVCINRFILCERIMHIICALVLNSVLFVHIFSEHIYKPGLDRLVFDIRTYLIRKAVGVWPCLFHQCSPYLHLLP